MFTPSFSCLVLFVCHMSGISQAASDKAIMVDWVTKMWLGGDISRYLGGSTKKMPILKQRERQFEGDTGLSLLLPDTCPSDECVAATCVESPSTDQRNVFLLAKREDGEWEVKCALFDDVELPELYTGQPEARSLGGDDRTRGLAADQPQQQTSSSTPVKKTMTIQGFGSDPPAPAGMVVESLSQDPVQPSVDCEELFSSNAEKFFSDCCMRTGAAESDSRCVLKTLVQLMENQQKPAKAPTTTIRTTTKKISDGFGVTESDVIEEEEIDSSNTTAKADSAEADEFFSPSESEKVMWSLTGQISTWRSKYFTVLGFFLVFLVLFLLIIAALIYKLRAAKDAPPSSPGGSGCGGPSPEDDRAPLTPATQQAQTFQY